MISCPAFFSDHCAVVPSVSIPIVVPPGPGLWKLNVSVLEEEEYFHVIRDFCGLLGDVASISFLPWLSGGRWVRVGSRVLRYPSVLDGLCLLRKSAIF